MAEPKREAEREQALNRAKELPNATEPIYLTYAHGDKDNPRNWPNWKRWYITCFASMLNVLTCLCAGGYSSGQDALIEEFGVSAEVGTVGLSMYILGFAIGPLMLAPLSEYFGRNPVYVWSWLLLVIFQLPLALAPNIATVIVCRLLQGFFGSAPLTNTGGTVSDLWARDECGNAMAVYGLSSTFGPPLALVISGYIALEKGWRWLFWVYMAIFGGFWILFVLTVPETRHSIILDKKTQRLRKRLRAEGFAAAEHITDANADEKKGLHTLFVITLTRPFRFLFTEPITFAAAIYNGWIYGIVYLLNEAFPLVFGPTGHGFNTGEWGASFAGLCVGSLVAAFLHPVQERYYLRRVARNDGKGVPEARMYLARGGTFLLPISLFWFAWTSYSTVHWIVPIIASAFFGAGIYIIILAILNYVVDSYQTYSASALAGVILVRNLVGAGFPLFARQMYEYLGLEWASTLLAFLSIVMCPIPWVFFYKGEEIRKRSPWAREHFAQDEDKPH
ncbi:major facilitator superfamily domain-containing protein [Macrophomina phaseolina]|uniref:Major facilitator superfamily domain-containing protein n=1 Tax=Macrophomina phaseolina TaxID=35725 RepID=A0ABQ8GLD7_9PEZI|nr:major facilitator superfamily domain-containing protein [Macrophomina phaseolina]